MLFNSTWTKTLGGPFPPNPFGLRYLGGHYMIQYLGVENDLCWGGLNSYCFLMIGMVICLKTLGFYIPIKMIHC